MDETEELIRLCCRALAVQMAAAPGLELQMTEACVLGLTDEPLADFNMLTLGDDPDAEGFLVHAVRRAKARRLPLLAVMSPRAAAALAPIAKQLGLTPAGTAPLMVLRAATTLPPGRPIELTRALGPQLVRVAGDLAAAAFDVPRDSVARCIDVGVTDTAGFETWIAWEGERPVSAVTITAAGDTAGVSLMATPPALQRQGFGRALLTRVVGDFRHRGTTRFYLSATAAGRPLYESLGFETIATLSAWLLAPDPG